MGYLVTRLSPAIEDYEIINSEYLHTELEALTFAKIALCDHPGAVISIYQHVFMSDGNEMVAME